jgi:hypothetical protein
MNGLRKNPSMRHSESSAVILSEGPDGSPIRNVAGFPLAYGVKSAPASCANTPN